MKAVSVLVDMVVVACISPRLFIFIYIDEYKLKE